jgi:penicillin-binding protein 2
MVTETRLTADFRKRVTVAALLVVVAMGVLLLRFGSLQVWQHQDYAIKAENNRVALLPIQAPRGLILDRQGTILARNDAGFSVELEPGIKQGIDEMLEKLTPLLNLTQADIRRFKRDLASARKFDPIAIKTKLTDEQVARIAVRLGELPGIRIERRPIRSYPFGVSSSHLIGHIGRVSKFDQERLEKEGGSEVYSGVSHIGKLGIEKSYEPVLKGEIGFQQIEIASSGRIIRELGVRPAVAGRNIQLSVDFGLQQMIEAAYGQRRGALVAMDPRNGEVLAFVSMPNFDPNAFVDGVDPDLWESLNTSLDKPMLNRALRGIYPPGSTYKPFMALAALASGERKPDDTINDPGYFMLGTHKFRDSKPEGHGRVDMKKSISVSSDTYYYKLAMDMGVDTIHKFISPFGFGQKTGIDMDGEVPGILPSSDWKIKRFGTAWLTGETPSIGIGQGYNAFTMLQLARATAAIANGGKLLKPRLVRSVEDGTGAMNPLPPVIDETLTFQQEWVDLVTDAMVEVNLTGTGARVMAGVPYKVAGKTGTAQVFSLKQDEKYVESRVAERLRDHSLYIAFAPADDPKVALAVVVENGGFGAAAAAPIARKVLDYLLAPPKPAIRAQATDKEPS